MDDDGIGMRDWYTTQANVPTFRVLSVEVKPLLMHV
jgi:hypothetical protein